MLLRMKHYIPLFMIAGLSACSLTAFSELDLLGDTGGEPLGDSGVGDDDDTETTDPDPTSTSVTDEDCNDGIDNDGDNKKDCKDPDCADICDADGDGEDSVAFGGDDCDDSDRNVYPGAEEICDDGKDNDCVGGDCVQFEADFEGGPGQGWTADGSGGGWVLANGDGRSGSTGFRSANISDGQDSGALVTVKYADPGSIAFWHSGSTEATYDKLIFYVDNVEVGRWSGTWAWQRDEFDVPAGTHTFAWRYSKDASISNGQDAALIDDVIANGGTL
jgi:hypothetical protein